MAAPSYVYKVADLKTGTFLGELPLTKVSFTSLFLPSGIGDFMAELPIGDPKMQKLDFIANTEGAAVELVIERNRVVVWTGKMLFRGYTSKIQTLRLSGRESFSYFDSRDIEDNLTYAAVDQGLILQDILTRAAGKPDGDIRVDLPTTAQLTTGTLRDRTYLSSDQKPISMALEELAAVDGGFEFALLGYWSKNVLRHRLTFGFPQLGQTTAPWEFDETAQIIDYDWFENEAAFANEVFGLGDDGSGNPRISRAKLVTGRYALHQQALSRRAVTQLPTLYASAVREVKRLNRGDIKPGVRVRGDLSPQFGSYLLGDNAKFVFADPRFNNGRNPDPPAGDGKYLPITLSGWRIGGWTVNAPNDSQGEEVALLLVPVAY